jgi:GT2 family glycosyltransferase
MAEPLVSVIIVHWNEAELLRNCLRSLERSDYPNLEIIVSDNHSTDDGVAMVRKEFPRVQVIANEDNLGFARGNNVGIRASKGVYVAILNADTIVEPTWIRLQVEALEADPTIGMCQGKMMLMREPGKINSVGMTLTREGLIKHIGDGEVDAGQHATQRPIFAVSGACAFCRRRMLDRIGLFDEDFFVYCEDWDLSWRAWIGGWRCVYVPDAVLHHFRNFTVEANSSLYWYLRYLNHRNRIWTLLKNASWPTLLTHSPSQLWYDLVMTGKGLKAWLTRSREPVELKARWDALCRLPRMLRKRRELQRTRVTPEAQIRELAFAQPP